MKESWHLYDIARRFSATINAQHCIKRKKDITAIKSDNFSHGKPFVMLLLLCEIQRAKCC